MVSRGCSTNSYLNFRGTGGIIGFWIPVSSTTEDEFYHLKQKNTGNLTESNTLGLVDESKGLLCIVAGSVGSLAGSGGECLTMSGTLSCIIANIWSRGQFQCPGSGLFTIEAFVWSKRSSEYTLHIV